MIKYIDGDKYENIYVVGDIHGEYHKLLRQLNEIGFDQNKDLLMGVGDLVDRGLNSLECAFLPDEPWFETVVGNHEDFCIQGYKDYRTEFYHKMQNNGGAWFYQLPKEHQKAIVDVFTSLPVMIELSFRGKKYGFVHADLPFEDWEHVKSALLMNDVIDGRTVRHYCLWDRRIVNKTHVEIGQIDQVFLGHTPVSSPKDVGNCKFIDLGSVFTGGDLAIIKL